MKCVSALVRTEVCVARHHEKKGRNSLKETQTSAAATGYDDDIVYPSTIAFILFHLACFGILWTGITWQSVAIAVFLYWLRIFAIGAGYHRYFSHRAYSTGRVFQFVLAVLAQSTGQKSVLWWAAQHRHHHLFSDTPSDFHSPRHRGFLYSHVGWIFARRQETLDLVKVQDLAKYPELMWLHRHERVPATVLAVLCFLIAGWPGLFVGFFLSTVLVFHGTFAINSLAHVAGRKRYVTGDDSRNNWLLAIFTMGEGWHNNHHAFQSSVRQGFHWWEYDPTFYILKLLSWFGVVWDLKGPPETIIRNEQRLGSRVIERAATQLALSFNCERIAHAIASALDEGRLSTIQGQLRSAGQHAAKVVADAHLPHLPTRAEIHERAKGMFVRTVSMEDIVERANGILLSNVGAKLRAISG